MPGVVTVLAAAAFVLAWSSGFTIAAVATVDAPPTTLLLWRFLPLAVLQVRDDQRLLRAEAVVEGLLRDAGRLGDRVDADGVDAAVVEEAGGGVEEAARTGREGGQLGRGEIDHVLDYTHLYSQRHD